MDDYPNKISLHRTHSDAYGTEFRLTKTHQTHIEIFVRERALLSEKACEAVAKLDYARLASQPFGSWEKVPEEYKVAFREQAAISLEAALREAHNA